MNVSESVEKKEEAKDYFSTVSALLCFLVGENIWILMFFSLLRQVLESYRKREEEAVANIDFEHLEDFRRRQSVGLFG